MNLVEEIYNEYAPKGEKNIKKNIEEALEDIKDCIKSGETQCDLYLDWTDLPDDWVVFPETLDYLRENGFIVEEKIHDFGIFGGKRYATVSIKM